MEGLLPDRATLDAWGTLTDAAAWGGLELGLVRAVTRQLGDPALSSLPIPLGVFEAALKGAARGDRTLTETEKAQWRLIFSAVRVKYGAPSVFSAEERLQDQGAQS